MRSKGSRHTNNLNQWKSKRKMKRSYECVVTDGLSTKKKKQRINISEKNVML